MVLMRGWSSISRGNLYGTTECGGSRFTGDILVVAPWLAYLYPGCIARRSVVRLDSSNHGKFFNQGTVNHSGNLVTIQESFSPFHLRFIALISCSCFRILGTASIPGLHSSRFYGSAKPAKRLGIFCLGVMAICMHSL